MVMQCSHGDGVPCDMSLLVSGVGPGGQMISTGGAGGGGGGQGGMKFACLQGHFCADVRLVGYHGNELAGGESTLDSREEEEEEAEEGGV